MVRTSTSVPGCNVTCKVMTASFGGPSDHIPLGQRMFLRHPRRRPTGGPAYTHGRHRERGQSLLEFALVFPIFVLFLGGIVQFGIILWGQKTLNQVVRDTAR